MDFSINGGDIPRRRKMVGGVIKFSGDPRFFGNAAEHDVRRMESGKMAELFDHFGRDPAGDFRQSGGGAPIEAIFREDDDPGIGINRRGNFFTNRFEVSAPIGRGI